LAALRRALGTTPGSQAEAVRIVYRLLPTNVAPWRERDRWLVAGLFALHPRALAAPAEGHYGPNLADSLRKLAHMESVSPERVERRLLALLNAEREDLDDHLRHAIAQLRAHEIGVDYVQLLRDLHGWGAEQRWVQRRWARAFWGQIEQPHTTTEGGVA
jgi:CRISPR type I-E-associated protein CasB/Cse2